MIRSDPPPAARRRVAGPPRAAVLIAAAAALVPGGARAAPAAEEGGSDLARRTFLNAEQLMREGKYDQALRDFQQVIHAFADSPLADDALMRVGSYHYPAESIAELGSASPAAQEAARPYFEQVRERYPQSDSAPHACFKLGLLSLEPGSPKRNLDEAYAGFYSVVNIYPESAWVGGALLGAAVAELGKRNYDRAILALERSLEESPRGPSSAEASFYLGFANARTGDVLRAAEAFQACRLIDEKSPAARSALDWLTLLHNVRLRPAAGLSPELRHDSEFVPRLPAGEDLRGQVDLAVDPSGRLLVADPRRGAVLTFAQDGSKTAIDPMEGAARVAVDADGRPLAAAPGRVDLAGPAFHPVRRSGSALRPVAEIGGLWRGSRGDVYLLDLGEGELLAYGADPAAPRILHQDKQAGTRVVALAGGPEDRLYLLDRKGKGVLVLRPGEAPAPLYQPGSGPVLEEPVDVAVDALGDVYVLDGRLRMVLVLDPEGKRLTRIAPPAGSPGELVEPAAVAVGPQGEVYVYDERKRTVLRFR
jgi:TolA-binding protein